MSTGASGEMVKMSKRVTSRRTESVLTTRMMTLMRERERTMRA
jgi:hypothetical protein